MEREVTDNGFPGLVLVVLSLRLSSQPHTGYHHVPTIVADTELGRSRNRDASERSLCAQLNMAQCPKPLHREMNFVLSCSTNRITHYAELWARNRQKAEERTQCNMYRNKDWEIRGVVQTSMNFDYTAAASRTKASFSSFAWSSVEVRKQ